MKSIFFLLALLFTTNIYSQVPLILKAENVDTFEVFVYEVQYHFEGDSLKVDNFLYIDLPQFYAGPMSYGITLPKNNWYLVLSRSLDGVEKTLFFKTESYIPPKPLIYIADFSTTLLCYVVYDPKEGKYVNVISEF
jgi:hypothetical protein